MGDRGRSPLTIPDQLVELWKRIEETQTDMVKWKWEFTTDRNDLRSALEDLQNRPSHRGEDGSSPGGLHTRLAERFATELMSARAENEGKVNEFLKEARVELQRDAMAAVKAHVKRSLDAELGELLTRLREDMSRQIATIRGSMEGKLVAHIDNVEKRLSRLEESEALQVTLGPVTLPNAKSSEVTSSNGGAAALRGKSPVTEQRTALRSQSPGLEEQPVNNELANFIAEEREARQAMEQRMEQGLDKVCALVTNEVASLTSMTKSAATQSKVLHGAAIDEAGPTNSPNVPTPVSRVVASQDRLGASQDPRASPMPTVGHRHPRTLAAKVSPPPSGYRSLRETMPPSLTRAAQSSSVQGSSPSVSHRASRPLSGGMVSLADTQPISTQHTQAYRPWPLHYRPSAGQVTPPVGVASTTRVAGRTSPSTSERRQSPLMSGLSVGPSPAAPQSSSCGNLHMTH